MFSHSIHKYGERENDTNLYKLYVCVFGGSTQVRSKKVLDAWFWRFVFSQGVQEKYEIV